MARIDERFVKAYLDPANQALAGVPLANQDGKVAKTYEAELVDWLKERFGFSGDTEQARNFFAALPAEQQRVFARDVYFAELKAGGREYNEAGGVRQGSYLRGREAIDLLFPSKDAAGNAITYKGDITMFGGAVCTPISAAVSKCSPRAAGKHSASRAMRRRPPPGSSPRARAISSCMRRTASCWARAGS